MEATSAAAQQDERRCVIDFDHHSAAFNADPHAAWMALQDTPLAWSEQHGGFWVVADHEGHHDVMHNFEVFTSDRVDGVSSMSIPSTEAGTEDRMLPIEVDPPFHTQVRQLLNARLSPAASRALQPVIERWVTDRIDAVIGAGECDLLYDLTGPVPAYVTLDWLGYPHDHILEAAETFHHLVGYPPESQQFIEALSNFTIQEQLLEACRQRRAEPRDDLISWLMTQTLDGEPVSDSVIVRLGFIIVAGGVDTTTSLTSSALVHLNRDHALRQRLIDDPSLLDSATEEFLRVYPPLTSLARGVRTDFEYRGCPMRQGDHVLVSRYAANFDATVFDAPQEFRADRFPNRHVTFGAGPHRCVGSHLARLMFQEMLRQVLTRMPDYELDEARIAPYPDRGAFYGWTALPATFTPGRRVGVSP